jgi:hypothetical protein
MKFKKLHKAIQKLFRDKDEEEKINDNDRESIRDFNTFFENILKNQ